MTKKIGFVGIGVMGNGMVQNLLKNSYEVHVFTRTKAKAQKVLDKGAKWSASLKELAEDCSTIITILGYPEDVRQVYLGEDGLVSSAKEGSIPIDMTTSDPQLAKEIYSEAKKRNISCLDAPVSGGDIGAKEARLSIMVGGEEEAFEESMPVLKLWKKTLFTKAQLEVGRILKWSIKLRFQQVCWQ